MAGEEKPKEKLDNKFRVKVYVLNEQRCWDDKGTGHVDCILSETKQSSLSVRSESDGTECVLLDSKILMDTLYQKQQETLIVWNENDNCDLALSFQEKTGCEEIWEKICSVQGKDPSNDVTQEVTYEQDSDDNDTSTDSGQVSVGSQMAGTAVTLPACELGKLREILDIIQSCLTSPLRKESLALAVETEDYIPKLLELFKMCEDLDNLESLKIMYQIVKNLFLLNKNALLEIMFSEKHLKDVVGALEYDPILTEAKKHRQYLWNEVAFREVIPIISPDLRAKIHQTYRVQYIQDAILPAPSIFEENMLTSLSSFIFFNRVEIVALFQDDDAFLHDLFGQLTSPETEVTKRKDLTLFLKEFCTFAQSLQPQGPQGKDGFFKTLSGHGILKAIEQCMQSTDDVTRAAATEIFAMVVDYSPPLARDYMLNQPKAITGSDEDNLFVNILIRQLFSDPDPELSSATQLLNILRILVDPENMMSAAATKSEKAEFLGFFYKRAMPYLCKPLIDNTSGKKPLADDYVTANRLSLILELLCFCIEHHSFHVRNFVIAKKILERVLVLLTSKHSFLALGALRLFRRVVHLKDEFYYRHIVKNRLLESIVRCFHGNGPRYNLLNSALLELFEFIRTEEIKTLMFDFVENFIEQFADVTYVNTFKAIKNRYDTYKDRDNNRYVGSPMVGAGDSIRTLPTPPPIWRRGEMRDADKDEEGWFEEDEEWDEDLPTSPVTVSSKPVSTNDDSPVPTLQRTKSVVRPNLSQEKFPSVLKNIKGSDDDGIFGLGNSPRPLLGRDTLSRITIRAPKLIGQGDTTTNEQSQGAESPTTTTPTVSEMPEVSSSESPPASISSNTRNKVSLVDYDDDSDSDDDMEGASSSSTLLRTDATTAEAESKEVADDDTTPPLSPSDLSIFQNIDVVSSTSDTVTETSPAKKRLRLENEDV